MYSSEFRAQFFAIRCHGSIGQTRKYTGEPYIVHPATVAEIVRIVPHTEEMLCAAWLHDVVEDTPATVDQIRDMFGDDVSEMVEALTNIAPTEGTRAQRKAIDRARLAGSSPAVQTIKLADIIDNVRDLSKADPRFASLYLAEKRLDLEVLTQGDPELWLWADHLTRDYHNNASAGRRFLQHFITKTLGEPGLTENPRR